MPNASSGANAGSALVGGTRASSALVGSTATNSALVGGTTVGGTAASSALVGGYDEAERVSSVLLFGGSGSRRRADIITQARACELVHEQRQRVDVLYEIMTSRTGALLRRAVHGLRRYIEAKFELELNDPVDGSFRREHDAFFAHIDSNEPLDRMHMLGVLFERLEASNEIVDYFCSAVRPPLVDRRAFAEWQRRWLEPALDDYRNGGRCRTITALVEHLVVAYSRLLSADPREHPRYAAIAAAPPPPPPVATPSVRARKRTRT